MSISVGSAWAHPSPLPSGLTRPAGSGDHALQEPPQSPPPLPPGLAAPAEQAEDAAEDGGISLPFGLQGFWEVRGSPRLQDDPDHSRGFVLGEARLQLGTEYAWRGIEVDFTGDLVVDGVLEEFEPDLRRLRLTWSPVESMDLRLGRQILTWGTGDLVFINDLFPKDWPAFLSGRDDEYLKAPTDAARVGWFSDVANLDFVYSPRFDADRFITGARISFWNQALGRRSGDAEQVTVRMPDKWFRDDEFALRAVATGRLSSAQRLRRQLARDPRARGRQRRVRLLRFSRRSGGPQSACQQR